MEHHAAASILNHKNLPPQNKMSDGTAGAWEAIFAILEFYDFRYGNLPRDGSRVLPVGYQVQISLLGQMLYSLETGPGTYLLNEGKSQPLRSEHGSIQVFTRFAVS